MIDRFSEDHAFLSNFYVAHFVWEGKTWPTAEHAFQAAKTLDPAERERIRKQNSPRKAKSAGRKVNLRKGWDGIRVEVMKEVVRAKFEQNADLMEWLLATGDEDLVEGNHWHDRFWGVCQGRGQNHLGKVLMEVRRQERDRREGSE